MAGILVSLVALYEASVHAVPGNSDGATVILEGQAISTGHIALQGWAVGLDAFWTLDALVYAVAVGVIGLHPILLNLVPAVLAAAVVIVGIALSREGAHGTAAIAGGVAVFALLGLPSFELAHFFLQGPLHVGTALCCLVAFAGLRQERFSWTCCVSVVLFAMGILGDLQTLVFGVAPAFLAGLVAMRRRRNWRAGIVQVGAAASSVVLAVIIRLIAEAVGTFRIVGNYPVSSSGRILHNVPFAITSFAQLFGVGGQSTGNSANDSEFAHIVALALVVVAVVVAIAALIAGTVRGDGKDALAIVHLFGNDQQKITKQPDASTTEQGALGVRTPEAWRLDDLLVLALIADFAVFVSLTYSNTIGYVRYLTAAVIFAVVLTGRLVARFLAAHPKTLGSRVLLAVGGVLTITFACGFGFDLATPVPVQPAVAVGRFLAEHHLTEGIGGYWIASIVTVETSDAVKVRPVIQTKSNLLAPYGRGDTAWFDGSQHFDFLVYAAAQPFGKSAVVATLGTPTRTYVLANGYDVAVWSQTFTLTLAGAS